MNGIVEVIPQSAQPLNTPTGEMALAVARLAENLDYRDALTVGALEDGIRFYQGRTVEAVLEMGKRLLLLKEMCPHGEFANRLQMLGFAPRMAQKFMQAVLKLSNANSNSLLQKVDSQTKLLELITLDDTQLEALNSGESVGSITLDDIETMSVSELKKALKEARADARAKDDVLINKNKKIDELDSKLNQRLAPQETGETLELQLHDELSCATRNLLSAVSQFNLAITTIKGKATNDLMHFNDKLSSELSLMYERIAQMAVTEGIDIDFAQMVTPDWSADWTTEDPIGEENGQSNA